MLKAFSVNYKSNEVFSRQVFDTRAEASAFAKKISKASSSRATIYKCNGYYDRGIFHEVESNFICWYVDGKKAS